MGFFSWLTADMGESIPNRYSGREMRTVYLLQPGGKPPIAEPEYEGYGVFGGKDAFVWLAEQNLLLDGASASDYSEEDLRLAGIMLDSRRGFILGAPYEKTVFGYGGAKEDLPFTDFFPIFKEPSTVFTSRWDEPIRELDGLTLNEIMDKGLGKPLLLADLYQKYPLKFSFNKEAKYEDLPASPTCPDQGYFYPENPESFSLS